MPAISILLCCPVYVSDASGLPSVVPHDCSGSWAALPSAPLMLAWPHQLLALHSAAVPLSSLLVAVQAALLLAGWTSVRQQQKRAMVMPGQELCSCPWHGSTLPSLAVVCRSST